MTELLILRCNRIDALIALVSRWGSPGVEPPLGEPWKLWVTDQPDGAGTTVLTLEFAAVEGDMLARERTSPQLATSYPEIAEAVMASSPDKSV